MYFSIVRLHYNVAASVLFHIQWYVKGNDMAPRSTLYVGIIHLLIQAKNKTYIFLTHHQSNDKEFQENLFLKLKASLSI